jgi:hypothetical protein
LDTDAPHLFSQTYTDEATTLECCCLERPYNIVSSILNVSVLTYVVKANMSLATLPLCK